MFQPYLKRYNYNQTTYLGKPGVAFLLVVMFLAACASNKKRVESLIDQLDGHWEMIDEESKERKYVEQWSKVNQDSMVGVV